MTARMRRLVSDWEQVRKDFAGHKNIIITPVEGDPPEKYHVTYFVNGIYLLSDGRVEVLSRHEVEITLHAEYPRYKPVCKILTPIWHPNFRDGQICIGDIWGAGESLTDIIINIGDMIQYKSWNSFSPLSAEAAEWAIENKHLFPVGNENLYIADYASAKDTVEIDLFDDDGAVVEEVSEPAQEINDQETTPEAHAEDIVADEKETTDDGNDFEITAEELEGIEFVPTAQRMQSLSGASTAKGKKINFKTILVKGLVWALIGALVGFFASEITSGLRSQQVIASLLGLNYTADFLKYSEMADEELELIYEEFEAYCKANGYDSTSETVFKNWAFYYASDEASQHIDNYNNYDDEATTAFSNAYRYEYNQNEDVSVLIAKLLTMISTAIWSGTIALFVGLFLGLGEGIFYGSKSKALIFALIGSAVASTIGCGSGFVAQFMYSILLGDDTPSLIAAIVRGIGWAIMGLGVGFAIGLIKPAFKRIIFCTLGGMLGGYIGGFLFNYICDIIPIDFIARGVALIIMGMLIGLGVGLLEQVAKKAWLKVIRGEFEGKEYLVFAGKTSIGNNGKNTIVLFKDKLVGPHHCDIVLEGGKYVLYDRGTPMGTVVNGRKVNKHVLRKGDSIAVGNSVLVFNTK